MNQRTLYAVAITDKAERCHKCGVVIYLITTGKGFRKAVDCRVEGTRTPTAKQSGEGIEHAKVCAGPPKPKRIVR